MKTDLKKLKSASVALIFVLVVCFMFEVPHIQNKFLWPVNGDELTRMGANFGPLTILKKEYWRLFTYGLLHSNIVHWLLNMYALWEFGYMAEIAMGRRIYLFIYIFGGIVGGLASILFGPLRTSVGASASICAILGAFIFVSWFKRERTETEIKLRRAELLLLMVFLSYSLLLGLTSDFMDNAAHIGGFAAGVLAAALFTIKHKTQAIAFRTNLAASLALLAVCPVMAEISSRFMENNPIVSEYLLRQEGAKLIKEEKFLHGIGKFDEALKVIPDEPQALQGRGEALMKLDLYEAAKRDFDTILSKEPKHKGALFNRAIALVHLGQYQNGLKDMDTLVKLDPNQNVIYNNRAWFRLNDFQNPESLSLAMQDIEKSIALERRYPAAYDTRGTIYLIQSDYDKAKADFDKCAKVKDTSGAANFHLAIIAMVKGNKAEADKRLAYYQNSDYKPDNFELKFCREKLGLTGLAKEDVKDDTTQKEQRSNATPERQNFE